MKISDNIVFTGDFYLSDNNLDVKVNNYLKNPWRELHNVFPFGTKIVTNIECAFTEIKDGLPYKWANLRTSPDLSKLLDGLSLAIIGNNHSADFGIKGVRDTQKLLDNKGISYVGFGDNLNDALKPSFINLNGKTLGIVSQTCPTTNGENLATHTTAGVAPLGMQTLKWAIERAIYHCDALLIYLHWGVELSHDPTPDQLRLARHAIECGADAVVGCHSHTIQSYEQYKGRWIFYSLGNYLFKAGFGQVIHENGQTELIPLILEQNNRESLAVSFCIVPDVGEGRLKLDRIQPMRFDEDLIPKPISFSELTFNLHDTNTRLKKYVEENEIKLQDRSEPEFRAKLRNGILAYWYSSETINNKYAESFDNSFNKFRKYHTLLTNMKSVIVNLINKIRLNINAQ